MFISKKFVPIFIILLFFCSYPLDCVSGSKEDYELQERCGKRAEEKFKEAYGKAGFQTDGVLVNYINHYNKKLNKCFVLVTGTNIPTGGNEKLGIGTDKTLWDINENKPYGSFYKFSNKSTPSICDVLGRLCKSESEWDLLVKPYMEE